MRCGGDVQHKVEMGNLWHQTLNLDEIIGKVEEENKEKIWTEVGREDLDGPSHSNDLGIHNNQQKSRT